jgi:hypothetical protein
MCITGMTTEDAAMQQQQRSSLMLISVAVALGGCAAASTRSVQPDGVYCYRIGKSYRPQLTCTNGAVPSDAVEAEAKRFAAEPGVATLYLVRNRWADTRNVLHVQVGHDRQVDTIPRSLVRVRLPPGSHRLSFDWQGQDQVQTVALRAGEVRFLEINGSLWAWGSSYEWANGDIEGTRSRALKSKLIADLGMD